MNLLQMFAQNVKKVLNINVVQEERSMSDESFLEWLGIKRDRNGQATSEATYFTCLKMMSETIAKMPWKHYRDTPDGIEEMPPTDASRLLKYRPNPFMTPTAFWCAVEANRNHYGNGYVYVRQRFSRRQYGGELKLMDMWIMPSDCVQVLVDDEGFFGGKGKIWYTYSDKYSGEQYIFRTEDVLHFKTSFSFDGITGLPVQTILKTTVEGASASQAFLNNLYKNGLTAKAVLEYTGDLSDQKKEKLIQALETYGMGTKNTGRVLPIPQGMKLTPLDIKLSDSQFIELKKYTALQIAAAFGIKPNQINDYEKSSYSNSEMQQLAFLTDTMLFVLKSYEEEVNYKLLTDDARDEGEYFKLNEKVLLRTDSETQMKILTSAINNGVYMPNEARRKLDMRNADGGDQLIVNGNYIPLPMVGEQYKKGDPGTRQQRRAAAADSAAASSPPSGDAGGGDQGETAETNPEE